jgi:hypothetical protein
MPTFCRHNRFIERCPICSKDLPEDSPLRPRASRSSQPGAKRSTAARAPRAGAARPGGSSTRRAPRGESLRVRREVRAQDDGFRSALVPGLHASADAERLAREIAASQARLIGLAVEPPGRYADVKALAISDLEHATSICVDIAIPSDTRAAYRNWVERSGGTQVDAFRGDPSWTPERRFERLFERLALPGFPRGSRYELLVTLGRLGLYELRAGSLQLAGAAGASGDATTLAAKRIFAIGDPLLLERRAAALAHAVDAPIEALDRALAKWGADGRDAHGVDADALDEGALDANPLDTDALDEDALARAREALGL